MNQFEKKRKTSRGSGKTPPPLPQGGKRSRRVRGATLHPRQPGVLEVLPGGDALLRVVPQHRQQEVHHLVRLLLAEAVLGPRLRGVRHSVAMWKRAP